jgi:2-furoyl-CoA dehydrogenase FAD binding subunit
MKPAAFSYIRAESLGEALDALAQYGEDARIIAGGQSLGPMLNMRLAAPEVLIDIMGLKDLDRIEFTDDGAMAAACVTQARFMGRLELPRAQPLLREAMPWIGHVQTRSRGTICGSLANADPAAELPLLLTTIGGVVIAQSKRGQRGIPAAEFFNGMFETALAPDEILLAVKFDAPKPGSGVAFMEMAERHGDFAIVAVAAVADQDGVTLGLGGIGAKPVVKRFDGLAERDVKAVLVGLATSLDPQSDPKADAAYRRRLARELGLQTVLKAMERRYAV